MKINKWFAALISFVLLFHLVPSATAQVTELLVAELGGVSVVAMPQPSPGPGLLATKVVLRSAPGTQLVTFENIAIEGQVVQQAVQFFGASLATPFVDNAPTSAWSLMPAEWQAVDSHLLISPGMVGGGGGGSHGGIRELNDGTDPANISSQLPSLNGAPPVSGIGGIAMNTSTDAFFLLPEFQTNEIEFAYVMTPAVSTGDVFLTVGVLGDGIIDSGEPDGASFGFNGNDPLVIPFIPEPSAAALAIFTLAALPCLCRRGNRKLNHDLHT